MPRFLVALIVCSFAMHAQTSGALSLIDAVVLDADGRPVAGLKPDDFEITAGGKAEAVTRLTAVDAVRHTAVTSTSLPAAELTPDQIHRTTVFIVDDLCLSLDALRDARADLLSFVEKLAPGDVVSVLRTSGGSSRERRLTGDRGQLKKVIEAAQYLGGSVPAASCATAAWTAVTFALTGLEGLEGRKAVVLMSGDLPSPTGNAAAGIKRLAAAAMTAIYQVSAAAPALADATGGAAGVDLERVAAETASHYLLAFPSEGGEVQVKVRRPGLTVRARGVPAGPPLRIMFPAPDVLGELPLVDAMNNPFGGGIGVRTTELFSDSAHDGSLIQTLCYIDAHDLGYLHDSSGKYHLDYEIGISPALEGGAISRTPMSERSLTLTPEQYQRLLEEGLVETVTQAARGSGAHHVRVAIADRHSGAVGSADAFVDVRNMASPAMFLSSIAVEAGTQVKKGPAVRVFRPGDELTFTYFIYHASSDTEGRAQVETQTSLFAGGREAFTGLPAELRFAPSRDPARLQVRGRLKLDPLIAAGRYILHVNVRDLVAKEPRNAGQFIDFQVEP